MKANEGFCECGCGRPAPIAKMTSKGKGHVKGQPMRFIYKHRGRSFKGENNPSWNGGKFIDGHGYVRILRPDHPEANNKGYINEHRLIAEEVLGKSLPSGAVMHHVNGDKTDNRRKNLVICQDENYHGLLHKRQRAIKA